MARVGISARRSSYALVGVWAARSSWSDWALRPRCVGMGLPGGGKGVAPLPYHMNAGLHLGPGSGPVMPRVDSAR